MHRLILAIACVSVVAWGCASGPANTIRYETGSRAAATDDGLHRVQAYRTDTLYVLPGADLSGYTSFMLDPVAIFYGKLDPGELSNEFRPAERARFEADVASELNAALGAGSELVVTDTAGPATLRVRAQVVDLSLGVPRRASASLVSVYTTTEFRLFLDVADSVSGVSLLRQVDSLELHPASLGAPLASGGIAHPSATDTTTMEETAAMRQTIGNRARLLRESLDRVRSAGSLPEPRLGAT